MTDKGRPTVFLGQAGPLIAAGLRQVIRDLIAGGYVDVLVATGAILYQDIYQARGFRHYRGSPHSDDAELRSLTSIGFTTPMWTKSDSGNRYLVRAGCR